MIADCHEVFKIVFKKLLVDFSIRNPLLITASVSLLSLCPGNSRAVAGIHHVESLNRGTDMDSTDDTANIDDRNMIAGSSEVFTKSKSGEVRVSQSINF